MPRLIARKRAGGGTKSATVSLQDSGECGSIDNHEGWSAVHVRRSSGCFEKGLRDAWVFLVEPLA